MSLHCLKREIHTTWQGGARVQKKKNNQAWLFPESFTSLVISVSVQLSVRSCLETAPRTYEDISVMSPAWKLQSPKPTMWKLPLSWVVTVTIHFHVLTFLSIGLLMTMNSHVCWRFDFSLYLLHVFFRFVCINYDCLSKFLFQLWSLGNTGFIHPNGKNDYTGGMS